MKCLSRMDAEGISKLASITSNSLLEKIYNLEAMVLMCVCVSWIHGI